jgi:hypothetical protein
VTLPFTRDKFDGFCDRALDGVCTHTIQHVLELGEGAPQRRGAFRRVHVVGEQVANRAHALGQSSGRTLDQVFDWRQQLAILGPELFGEPSFEELRNGANLARSSWRIDSTWLRTKSMSRAATPKWRVPSSTKRCPTMFDSLEGASIQR